MSRKLTLLFLLSCLLMSGCHRFAPWRSDSAGDPSPVAQPARARLEAQGLEHDGAFLHGRLLVGAEQGKVRLDRRLVHNVSLTVASVSACETHERVPFVEVDYVTRPRTREHLLVLEPGQWYGRDIRFPLLAREITGKLGPPCIEIEIYLTSFEDRELARATFRALRRPEQPAAAPPADSPAQSPPPPTPRTPTP